jgi:hypothetical protein
VRSISLRLRLRASSLLALVTVLSAFYASPVLAQSTEQPSSELQMPEQPSSELQMPEQTTPNDPDEKAITEPSVDPPCTESDCNSLYYAGGASKQAVDTATGASDAFTKGRINAKSADNFSHAADGGTTNSRTADDSYAAHGNAANNRIADAPYATGGSAANSSTVDDGDAAKKETAEDSSANAAAPASTFVAWDDVTDGRSGSSADAIDGSTRGTAAKNGADDDSSANALAPALIPVAWDSIVDGIVSGGSAASDGASGDGAAGTKAADDGDNELVEFELAGFKPANFGDSSLALAPSVAVLLAAVGALLLARRWVQVPTRPQKVQTFKRRLWSSH